MYSYGANFSIDCVDVGDVLQVTACQELDESASERDVDPR